MQATVGIAVQVYSPAENVAEAVYGTAIAPTVFYEVRERSYLALRFGAGFIRQSGDAYAGSRYLTNGPRSYQTLVPVELALCGRVPMATGDRPAAMTLVLGGGIQRTFFREKYPESPVTRGSGFTTLFFAGPEFAVGRSASLSIEYRVTSGVILVRSDDESFDVDLEAGAVQIAFRQNF
jgi:hypothetical protein